VLWRQVLASVGVISIVPIIEPQDFAAAQPAAEASLCPSILYWDTNKYRRKPQETNQSNEYVEGTGIHRLGSPGVSWYDHL
jgi:hypothetical protein